MTRSRSTRHPSAWFGLGYYLAITPLYLIDVAQEVELRRENSEAAVWMTVLILGPIVTSFLALIFRLWIAFRRRGGTPPAISFVVPMALGGLCMGGTFAWVLLWWLFGLLQIGAQAMPAVYLVAPILAAEAMLRLAGRDGGSTPGIVARYLAWLPGFLVRRPRATPDDPIETEG
jgi:hypothetical protein